MLNHLMGLSDEQIEEMMLSIVDSPNGTIYKTLDEYPDFIVYFSRKVFVVVNVSDRKWYLLCDNIVCRDGYFRVSAIKALCEIDACHKKGLGNKMEKAAKRTLTHDELSLVCYKGFDKETLTDIIVSLANSRLEQPSTKLLSAKKTHSILKESMEGFINLPDVYSTALSDMAKEASGVEMDEELQFWINLHKKLDYEPHPRIKFLFV